MSRVAVAAVAAACGAAFGLATTRPLDRAGCVTAEDRWAGRRPSASLTNPVFSHRHQPFKLGEVINLTSETALFRFMLPNADDEFTLAPCSTLQALHKAGVNVSEHVQRMYTPISPNGTKGHFDIIVKKQKQGRMTEHLFSMQVGEALNFRLISCKMQYRPSVYRHIGLIGAGTGITPLLQVIRANAENPEDTTRTTLLYANPTERRILLKGMLDGLERTSGGKFQARYVVDRLEEDEPFDGRIGRITLDTVRETMPPPAPDTLIMVCGSDRLMNNVCGVPFAVMKPWSSGSGVQPAANHGGNYSNKVGGLLGALGYDSEHVYRF